MGQYSTTVQPAGPATASCSNGCLRYTLPYRVTRADPGTFRGCFRYGLAVLTFGYNMLAIHAEIRHRPLASPQAAVVAASSRSNQAGPLPEHRAAKGECSDSGGCGLRLRLADLLLEASLLLADLGRQRMWNPPHLHSTCACLQALLDQVAKEEAEVLVNPDFALSQELVTLVCGAAHALFCLDCAASE